MANSVLLISEISNPQSRLSQILLSKKKDSSFHNKHSNILINGTFHRVCFKRVFDYFNIAFPISTNFSCRIQSVFVHTQLCNSTFIFSSIWNQRHRQFFICNMLLSFFYWPSSQTRHERKTCRHTGGVVDSQKSRRNRFETLTRKQTFSRKTGGNFCAWMDAHRPCKPFVGPDVRIKIDNRTGLRQTQTRWIG